jgi:hypothetical protein
VRQGAITPEQSVKSLELQVKTPSKRVGQILLEMGAITFETLHATVKTQVQNLVLSLFTWSDGTYMFEPGPLPTHEAITLDWDTPGAVLQGLRGLPLNYIRPLVPPSDAVIERSPETGLLGELQLNSAEQKLLALLVGRHPMEQLLALDFIANESLLRGLVTFAALGLIMVHPGASREDIPVEGDDADGEHIDPLDQRPPVYVKQPAPVPEARPYVAPKARPTNGPTRCRALLCRALLCRALRRRALRRRARANRARGGPPSLPSRASRSSRLARRWRRSRPRARRRRTSRSRRRRRPSARGPRSSSAPPSRRAIRFRALSTTR